MLLTKHDRRICALKRRDGVDEDLRVRFAGYLADVVPRLVSETPSADGRPVTALFSPVGSEPNTMPLVAALHALGLPLALPVDWSHGNPLVYRRWVPGEPLAAGPLGIAEPLPEAPQVRPDVVFVPMVAFDRRGHRVGYGAGNVDKTLRALRAEGLVRAIGIAYAIQEESRIPNGPHDEPVDLVVTEREVIVPRAEVADDAPD